MADYSTAFPGTENPISESGVWVHQNVWFPIVETVSGRAQQTGPGNSGGNYLDSYAYLGGMGFGPNQRASGIIRKTSVSGFLECELLLRWSDTANSTQGYECYLAHDGAYVVVTRWTGTALSAPATITYFDEIARNTGVTAPQDGDLYEAQIVGNIITVRLNGELLITADVSSGGRTPIASGYPGIGFDRNAGDSAPDTYCFKSFTAENLFVFQERETSINFSLLSSLSLAFDNPVVAGSSIHVICSGGGTALTFTCSDDVNGSYGAAKDTLQSADGSLAHFVFDNTGSGTPNVTITPNAADLFLTIWIREIGGTSGYDTHAGQVQATPGTGTDAVTSGTATPSVQPGLISALSLNNFVNSTPAAGTGFTQSLSGWGFGLGTDGARAESRRYTSTTAAAGTFTDSSNNTHETVAAFFKEASGSLTAVAADTNTPSDSAVSITQRLSVGTDTNTPSDSAVSITQRLSVGTDTNTPTDSALGVSTRTIVAADTNTPTDSAAAAVGFPVVASDTSTPSDSAVSITQRLSVAVDTNTPTDSALGVSTRTIVAADTNTPTDSAVSITARLSVGTDTNTPTDSASSSRVPSGVAVASDTNTPTDSAVGISARSAMAEDFNVPHDHAICIGPHDDTIATYKQGTAFDAQGRMVTEYIEADAALPSGVKWLDGLAHTQDGKRLVTSWPGTSVLRYIDGFAVRRGGVQVITTTRPVRGAISGIPVAQYGQMPVSTDVPVRAVDGLGITADKRVSVTRTN